MEGIGALLQMDFGEFLEMKRMMGMLVRTSTTEDQMFAMLGIPGPAGNKMSISALLRELIGRMDKTLEDPVATPLDLSGPGAALSTISRFMNKLSTTIGAMQNPDTVAKFSKAVGVIRGLGLNGKQLDAVMATLNTRINDLNALIKQTKSPEALEQATQMLSAYTGIRTALQKAKDFSTQQNKNGSNVNLSEIMQQMKTDIGEVYKECDKVGEHIVAISTLDRLHRLYGLPK